jgi:hypothetical protein
MSGILQGVLSSFGGAAAPGQEAYVAAGTYSWIAPTGVTAVSVVCVGAGGGGDNYYGSGGGGGALAYINNRSVTPEILIQSLLVLVGKEIQKVM